MKYELIDTKDSSQKFGVCEICGKHAGEVFHQIERKEYVKTNGSTGYTHTGDYFGHKECLTARRA